MQKKQEQPAPLQTPDCTRLGMWEPHSSTGVKLEIVEDADIHLGRVISGEALEKRVCDPGCFIPYRV